MLAADGRLQVATASRLASVDQTQRACISDDPGLNGNTAPANLAGSFSFQDGVRASVSLSFGIMLIRPDDLQEVDHGRIVSVPAEHDVGSDLRRVARDGPVDDVLADADRADR